MKQITNYTSIIGDSLKIFGYNIFNAEKYSVWKNKYFSNQLNRHLNNQINCSLVKGKCDYIIDNINTWKVENGVLKWFKYQDTEDIDILFSEPKISFILKIKSFYHYVIYLKKCKKEFYEFKKKNMFDNAFSF